MSLESIEKLRELAKHWRKTSITPGKNPLADEVDELGDAIEREIAESYMRLPKDADGVPIHVGDMMTNGDTAKEVVGVGPDYYITGKRVGEFQLERHGWDFARDTRHSRTVEDVLEELEGIRRSCMTYEALVVRCAELAEELRELMADESR